MGAQVKISFIRFLANGQKAEKDRLFYGAGRLTPAAAEGGVEGDDGGELLEVVVHAGELRGEQVLLGGEDVGIVGFGVGFHELFGVFDGFLEEVDLPGAGGDLFARGLVSENGVGDFLAGGEEGFLEGEKRLLFLGFGDFETLAVEAIGKDGLGEAADEVAEEGRGVEETGEGVRGEAGFSGDGQGRIERGTRDIGELC